MRYSGSRAVPGGFDKLAGLKARRFGEATLLWVLTVIALAATLGLTVNPWLRDGWFETQYYLVGAFPGQDNYSPVAAPALLYRLAHQFAAAANLDLAGEFRVACVLQNILLLASACFVYYALLKLRLGRFAAVLSVGFLLAVLSTGLPQGFWSENTVLFLMSAVMWVLAGIASDPGVAKKVFLFRCVVCGVLIALLVVTRVVPVFLVPGLALLFWGRLSRSRVAQLVGVVSAITIVTIAVLVLSNYARFGRYELSNSSGRHLWQGIRYFSDSALANDPEYQAIKRLNPDLQGKDWWLIELPALMQGKPVQNNAQLLARVPELEQEPADPREAVLGRLAKRAIANEPAKYVLQGWRKFFETIGTAPYRLGYVERGGWDPLHRSDLLPSLADTFSLSPRLSATVEWFFRKVHVLFEILYPVTIVTIVMTYIAMLFGRIDQVLTRRRLRALLTLFLMAGASLALLAGAAAHVWAYKALLSSGICIVLFFAFAIVLKRSIELPHSVVSVRLDFALLAFLFLIFFGSLWFSWQIESSSPRNAIPYLPFWAVMLALSAEYWSRSFYRAIAPRGIDDAYSKEAASTPMVPSGRGICG